MKSYHKSILKLLKKEITPKNVQILEEDDEQIIRFLFRNYRNSGKKTKGYYLTDLGLSYLKEVSQCWEFQMSEDQHFLSRHIIWIERNTTAPYHYNRNTAVLTLFCPKLAMRLKLYGGDIDLLAGGDFHE